MTTLQVTHSRTLFEAVLESYDEIQNVRLLVKGAILALDSADNAEDRFAVQEILTAGVHKTDEIMKALMAANEADVIAIRQGAAA